MRIIEKEKLSDDWINGRTHSRYKQKYFDSRIFKIAQVKGKGYSHSEILGYYTKIYSKELVSKNKRDRYMAILREEKFSKAFSIKIFNVSSSGYYKWLKNPTTSYKYDDELLKKIKFIFKEYQAYGRRRIKIALEREFNIFINVKTVDRYMSYLKLKSPIRQKRKNVY